MNGKCSGVENSITTNVPPGFNTRYISEYPFSKCSKLRTPKDTVIASNVLSANDSERQSSQKNFILSLRWYSSIFLRAIFSIPSDRSIPVILSGENIFSMSRGKSPVPVAMSSIVLGRYAASRFIAARLHCLSIPKVIILFSMSYVGAIVSNICRT